MPKDVNTAAMSAQPSYEELKARVAQLEAEGAPKNGIGLKVTEKGGLSVYGIQRFPVTLYAEGWERLLDEADKIRGFIKANGTKLTRKVREAKAPAA